MRVSLLIFSILGLAAIAAFGETGQNAAPQAQGPAKASSAVQIWDDRVFELGQKDPPPTTRKGASGQERYLGSEPDYNSGQRAEWLQTCESLRNDLRAYRDCFAKQKLKSGESLQQSRAEVEGRSALPARNIPIPMYDSEAQRNPAFDATVERTEE